MLRLVVRNGIAIVAIDDDSVHIGTTATIHIGTAEELRSFISNNNIDLTDVIDVVRMYSVALGVSEDSLSDYYTKIGDI